MPPLRVVALCALLGLSLAPPAAAQWKWRDKGGQMQYSDLPPPAGVAERDILQRPQAPVPRSAAAPTPAASAAPAVAAVPAASAVRGTDPELEARRRKAEQEQQARQKAEEERVAALRAENCTRARGYLRTLDEGVRIVRTDAKGEREYLDDKARADEVRRTREIIAADCR